MDGMYKIGCIDIEKFRCVSERIATDEVIITEERIAHIEEHHADDYKRFERYIRQMVESPQYILKDSVPDTAVIIQEFQEHNEHFRLILKLSVTESAENKKNSVLTFFKISKKKFEKYLRNKIILYKAE